MMAALFLAASGMSALAQDYGQGDAAAMPPIILPDQLTSPITGDFNAQGSGNNAADDGSANPDGGATFQAPYSVPGEETLDPETN
jgi:hypothetical protein